VATGWDMSGICVKNQIRLLHGYVALPWGRRRRDRLRHYKPTDFNLSGAN
jgi:hypothetical protein